MGYSRSSAPAPRSAAPYSPQITQKAQPHLRLYDVSALLPNGRVGQMRKLAPALPLFEDAFCAFARGLQIETDMGAMAIEDLLPGDRVRTADGEARQVLWIGTTTLKPGQVSGSGRALHLTRIMADSFGMARPMTDVITGPSARLLHTPERLRALCGDAQVLSPVSGFQDGVNVIQTTPPTPVQLFHFCVARHSIINVGGLQMETYHPGASDLHGTSQAMASLFLSLFPHLETLGDFGPLSHPRSGNDLDEARYNQSQSFEKLRSAV